MFPVKRKSYSSGLTIIIESPSDYMRSKKGRLSENISSLQLNTASYITGLAPSFTGKIVLRCKRCNMQHGWNVPRAACVSRVVKPLQQLCVRGHAHLDHIRVRLDLEGPVVSAKHETFGRLRITSVNVSWLAKPFRVTHLVKQWTPPQLIARSQNDPFFAK